MQSSSYNKFYRVYKNDTRVTKVSNNDFLPCKPRSFKNGFLVGPGVKAIFSIPSHFYSLPDEDCMYYGYHDEIRAMEKAKSGALKHIAVLISGAERSICRLKQYRNDHYTDLNATLLDSNIRRLEKELRG